ncbi:unnamed protein product [Victoria cruziana]
MQASLEKGEYSVLM